PSTGSRRLGGMRTAHRGSQQNVASPAAATTTRPRPCKFSLGDCPWPRAPPHRPGQAPGLGPGALPIAFFVFEALFKDRGFLRVGLANVRYDLLKPHGFAAHGRPLDQVSVQNHLGPVQGALRWRLLDRRAFRSAATATQPGKGHEDYPNPE